MSTLQRSEAADGQGGTRKGGRAEEGQVAGSYGAQHSDPAPPKPGTVA